MTVTGRRTGTLGEAMRRLVELTPVQRTTLTHVAGHDGPVTTTELADELGVRPSSVRDTLEALRAGGLVDRVRMPVRGRGRPSWGYVPLTPIDVDAPVRMLADALAATAEMLRDTHPDPGAAAQAIGEAWAERMVGGQVPDHSGHTRDAYRELNLADHMGKIAFFSSSLGFTSTVPKPEPTTLVMHSCPFVRGGEVDPLVCRIHLGLLQRTIDLTSQGRVATILRPWVTPATCVAHLQELPGAD